MDLNDRGRAYREDADRLRQEFGTVIVGNRDVLGNMLKALFTGGTS